MDHVPEQADHEIDTDSSMGDETRSETQTLSSSNYQFNYENGRRYHGYKDATYYLPNDQREAERLDLQHAIWKVFGEGKLHFAPLNPNIQRILDVGTGTGSWAMDIADEFPSAEIVGTDLSPIQPPFVPPNVTFLVDDLNVDWLFSTKFDYIHSRMLCTAIRDWKRYCQQAYDNLKPGGWIELQEVEHPFYAHTDNTAPPTNALINWSQKMYEAALQVGIDLSYPSHLEPALTSAGFTNITHEVHIGPWGTWHPDFGLKKLGYLLAKDLEQGLSGLCMGLFTRNLGWTMGEVEAYLVSVRGAIWDEGEHVVLKGNIYYAQKPELLETGDSDI